MKKSMIEWLMEFSSRVENTKTKTIKECEPIKKRIILSTNYGKYSLN